MKVTESGIKIEVSVLQCSNALEPIEVTELGMEIDFSAVQSKNARLPMDVTECEIVTVSNLVQ